MKVLNRLVFALVLTSCAPAGPHVSTAWNMTWSCDGNTNCASHIGAYSGAGQFASESDCLAWEGYFLNINYGLPVQSCTSCTGN